MSRTVLARENAVSAARDHSSRPQLSANRCNTVSCRQCLGGLRSNAENASHREPLLSARSFDFCVAMKRFCEDVCRRHPEFHHVDMNRIVVTFAQTRSPVEWGMQAKLTPMRFENGAITETRDGRKWAVQRLFHDGREMLYILTFYLPRFLNLSYTEKLVTVFHELYHISPTFDGDIRRFEGACYMHTGSQAGYDRQMAVFVKQYLRMKAPASLRSFMRYDFRGLCRARGAVVGLKLPVPRLIPIDDAA